MVLVNSTDNSLQRRKPASIFINPVVSISDSERANIAALGPKS